MLIYTLIQQFEIMNDESSGEYLINFKGKAQGQPSNIGVAPLFEVSSKLFLENPMGILMNEMKKIKKNSDGYYDPLIVVDPYKKKFNKLPSIVLEISESEALIHPMWKRNGRGAFIPNSTFSITTINNKTIKAGILKGLELFES